MAASLEVEAFTARHVTGAVGLLANRHDRHCAHEPLLACSGAAAALRREWEAGGVTGAAALRDGRLVVYVFGRVAAMRSSVGTR